MSDTLDDLNKRDLEWADEALAEWERLRHDGDMRLAHAHHNRAVSAPDWSRWPDSNRRPADYESARNVCGVDSLQR